MNSKTYFFMVFAFVVVSAVTVFSAAKQTKCRVYIGTGSMGSGAGIYSSILNLKTGKLSKAKLAAKATRSGIITINPAGTILYTSGKPGNSRGWGGSLCAFKIDRGSGKLKLLNSQPSKGIGPCYLAIDPAQRYLFVPHFRGGNCSVLPIAKNGSLKPVSSVVQHSGSGTRSFRQSSPHPHAAVFDSAGRYIFVPDLGLDKILIYKLNSPGKIVAHKPPFAKVKSGGGPRHFAFHPSGKFAYVNLELTSAVTAFKYNPKLGALKAIQTISTLPKSYAGRNANAGIRITPDGKFLYVSNRGHNSIAIFSIAPATGKLTFTGSESTRGDVPQAINIDPTGNYIIATDKRAGSVRVFRINRKTGQLTQTDTLKVSKVGNVAFQLID
jgi:6-phosphogluconolactonase